MKTKLFKRAFTSFFFLFLLNGVKAQVTVIGPTCPAPCAGLEFDNQTNCDVTIRVELFDFNTGNPCIAYNAVICPASVTTCILNAADFSTCLGATWNVGITMYYFGTTPVSTNNSIDFQLLVGLDTGPRTIGSATCGTTSYDLSVVNGCLVQLVP